MRWIQPWPCEEHIPSCDRPVRILLTVHSDLDLNAGAPGVAWQLSRRFQAAGHSAKIYSFDNLTRVVPDKLRQVVFPFALAKLLAKTLQDYDVVDASTGDTWFWSSLPRRGPLLVVRSHGLEHVANEQLLRENQLGSIDLSWKYPFYHGGWRLKEVAGSLRRADLSIFLNSYERDYAIANLGVNRERAVVLPNGVPDQLLNLPFEPTPSPGETVKVAQIGRYSPMKGARDSAAALTSLLAHHPEVEISFLGTRIPRETVLRDFDPALHRQIMVVPHYNRNSLPTLLRGHQIKLSPTLSEGFSLALVEAMACGLAPVVTAIPACLEIVEDGRNGLTLPLRDPAAICSALERLLNDRALLDRLRRAAYNDAQRYGWSRIAAETLDLYEEAAPRRTW